MSAEEKAEKAWKDRSNTQLLHAMERYKESAVLPTGEETFTKRQLEMAYCIGLLRMENCTVDKLAERLNAKEWDTVYKIVTDPENNPK